MDAEFWDAMYRSREQVFSGNPNGVLVAEVTGLSPGQALDVGCGEGADARWLAEHGWHVTAVDISRTALERAARLDTTGRVAWSRADLSRTPLPAGAFDLVSAQYFPLPGSTLRGLLAAVAPGGTLLVVSHDLAAPAAGHHQPADVARLLGDEWKVLVDETRPRTTPPPPGTHHTHDTVLRAQRLR
ncbi:class I SAM-dependent methyltransferase [Amycolatopsis thermophila]|uniref:SAM-dependent methyltransferase n=1 Tax=Amycolatopsis thermophila TaxID=206084 RepID=A0ABU0EWF9_9PSEU|nr:class I SAM-dependent methyltransferase [Amycolatopsis thermophila]MDQ0379637.1 SAM-dependent methyltransferase [Amycolatopsis thermophila]